MKMRQFPGVALMLISPSAGARRAVLSPSVISTLAVWLRKNSLERSVTVWLPAGSRTWGVLSPRASTRSPQTTSTG